METCVKQKCLLGRAVCFYAADEGIVEGHVGTPWTRGDSVMPAETTLLKFYKIIVFGIKMIRPFGVYNVYLQTLWMQADFRRLLEL